MPSNADRENDMSLPYRMLIKLPTARVARWLTDAASKIRGPMLGAALLLGWASAAQATPTSSPLRILFTGDVSFGENYQQEAARKGRPDILAERGYDYPLAGLAAILRRADYTIINLETPLTDRERSPLADSGKDYLHWGHIDKTPSRLVAYGVDAVGLANNHVYDFGAPGMVDTFAALKKYGIASFGAGMDGNDAATPLVRVFKVGAREITIAVIAGFERRKSYEEFGFYAGQQSPGVSPIDIERFAAQIRELKRQTPGIFVISYAHWGSNYAWRTPEQQKQAQAMIDAGADLVIGHHGHMMQELESYKGKWIAYGLGNFIFNSAGRFAAYPDAIPYGLALELVLEDRGPDLHSTIRLFPILSDNLKVDYQPRIATGSEANQAFAAMLRRSALGKAEQRLSRGTDEIGPFLELSSAFGLPK